MNDSDLADRYGAALFLVAGLLMDRSPEARKNQVNTSLKFAADAFDPEIVKDLREDALATFKAIRRSDPARLDAFCSDLSARERIRDSSRDAREEIMGVLGIKIVDMET